jgi:hypothetical protein
MVHFDGGGGGAPPGGFPWDDVAVGVAGALIGVSFCHAAADAFLNDHLMKGIIGLAIGLPSGVFGLSFRWWKGRLGERPRQCIAKTADRWWPVALILTFLYVAGGSIFPAEKITPANPVPPNTPVRTEPWISGASFYWNGNTIVFAGQFAKSGESLRLYISCNNVGSPAVGEEVQINRDIYVASDRHPIGHTESFVRNQLLGMEIANVVMGDNNTPRMIKFGKDDKEKYDVGVSSSSFCQLFLVDKDNKEEVYPFLMISREYQDIQRKPLIIAPNSLISMAKIINDESK